MKTLWENGTIGPINHITTFDISKLEAAMSFFAKGVHTGKLVITFQDPETKLKVGNYPCKFCRCVEPTANTTVRPPRWQICCHSIQMLLISSSDA